MSTQASKHATVITVANNKGGCGKTCTAQNLAAALSRMGLNVLCIDMDGQANLTACFGMTPNAALYNALTSATGRVSPEEVRPAKDGAGKLDLLPASQDLAALDSDLARKTDRATRLARLILPLRSAYDVVIIDTPPSMGLLSINALHASDLVIVTTQAQPLDVRGLLNLRGLLTEARNVNSMPIPFRVLVTQYDRRKSLHRLTLDMMKDAQLPLFDTTVRDCIAIAEATATNLDIFDYAPKSNGAQDYAALCSEVEALI